MSSTLTINGTGYTFPGVSDENWGQNVSNWAAAVSTHLLQKTGGAFTLSAEVDFGASYGLKSLYYKSRATNPASSGQVRLGSTESVSWRNAANNADLALKANASDKLEFNSVQVATLSGTETLTNKTISGASNTLSDIGYSSLSLAGSIVNADVSNSAAIAYSKLNLSGSIVNADINASAAIAYSKLNLASSIVNADVSASAAIAYSKLNLSSSIVNADISGSAAIARSKVASGTASHVVINDGSGVLSSEAQLDKTRGGTGISSTATFPASGTVVTRDATETLTNKTLTSPTITTAVADDGLDFNEEASLSSPSAGKRRLGLKSDGKLYLRDSSGNEVVVGSGSGTGINYVSNPDAETDTSGYSTYADAAGTSPVDGTGGAPTVTWTRSTSNPLRGLGSFLLTKDAANRQGEGVGYAFTIADADKAKVLTISFEYEIASGTYADNDLSVWIYDVTNGTLIQPAGHQIKNVGIESKHSATFQTASNSTSYRLIFHVSSTSASAYTVKFDNISVGPSAVVQGTPVTDWASCSVTSTFTNTTTVAKRRRIGDSVEYAIYTTFSGAPGAATLAYTLPDTIDLTKLGAGAVTGVDANGTALIYDNSTSTRYLGVVQVQSSNSIRISTNASTSQVTQAVPVTFAASDLIEVRVVLPVAGWSSNLVMSDSADTRVVSAAYYGTASTVTNTGDTVIAYSTLKHDTHGCYNTSTGRYTVKVPGKYRVAAAFETTPITAGTVDSPVIIYIWKNGTAVYMQQWPALATGSTFRTANILGTVDCVAGDYIEIAGNQQLSAGAKSLSNSIRTWLAIDMVSGPAQIAASETVSFRAGGGTTSLSSGSSTTCIFATEQWDTHGAYDTSTGIFTAPVSGVYQVNARVHTSAIAPGSAGRLFYANTAIGGTTATINDVYGYMTLTIDTTSREYSATLAGTVRLLAGQTLRIMSFNNFGTAGTMNGSQAENFFSMVRLGNY